MKLGVLFFGAQADESALDYAGLLDIARWADQNSLAFLSVPERHFDAFGGLFPNPVVLSAALATVTRDIQLRAGSVVLPLHDPLRLVEDWSVVDRLSGGRIALSFGSGWNVNDFVLAPDAYAERRELTQRGLAEIRELWRNRRAERRNGVQSTTTVTLYPQPVQGELPVWLTASRSVETFRAAGESGAHVLTHLENQDLDGLAERVAAYRSARARAGLDPAAGKVTLMQHTFVSDDRDLLRRAADELRRYLSRALDLEKRAVVSGGTMSGRKRVDAADLERNGTFASILDNAVAKYLDGLALIGSVGTCVQRIQQLRARGVDEIACLLDFLGDSDLLYAGLPGLAEANQLATSTAHTRAALERFMAGGQ